MRLVASVPGRHESFVSLCVCLSDVSSRAHINLYLVCGGCGVQICGGVQSASFRSDEIDQMLIDFVFALRRHRRYQGAAFVVAIEGNMSYIEADRIASIVQKSQVQPVVVLSEDGQQKGRYGVHTGHMEKSAYIEVIQALMVRGGLYWAAPVDFVGRYNRGAEQLSASILTAQRTEFQTTMYGEMMNYRSERRDPKVCRAAPLHWPSALLPLQEVGWGPAKVAIFGKGPGQKDDTFMSLQIAIYWAQYKITDDVFMDMCEQNGWWSRGDELQIRVAVRSPPDSKRHKSAAL